MEFQWSLSWAQPHGWGHSLVQFSVARHHLPLPIWFYLAYRSVKSITGSLYNTPNSMWFLNMFFLCPEVTCIIEQLPFLLSG